MRAISLSCVLLLVLGEAALAETLVELTKRVEGIEFGRCELLPRPDLKGTAIYAVIPARFDVPGTWLTRSLLLVGTDHAGIVQGAQELKLASKVPLREVLKVHCSGNRLEVRLSRQASGRTLVHRWNGRVLHAGSRKL